MLALSAIGASLLMLANTETYASMNYRMMSQARYGAEAGVLRAVNHLMNTYTTPTLTGADPLTNYNTTVSPVTYNGQPVILSAVSSIPSNYPVGATQTAFNTAAQGSLSAGQAVSFGAYATLVSMRAVVEYAQTAPTIIQVWQITGVGTVGGTRPAAVEVSSVLERNFGSAHSFGVFATQVACAAVSFGGGSSNDSYDSSAMTLANGVPVDAAVRRQGWDEWQLDGQRQRNGLRHLVDTARRRGQVQCRRDRRAHANRVRRQVTEGLIQLPQAITYPTPAPPSPMPPTTNVNLDARLCRARSVRSGVHRIRRATSRSTRRAGRCSSAT